MRSEPLARASAALVAGLLTAGAAQAGDLPAPTPPAVNWSGAYAGVQAGWTFSVIDQNGFTSAFSTPLQSYACAGGFCDGKRDAFAGGLTAGYNKQYANGTVLGVEADIAMSGLDGDFDFAGTAALSDTQRLASSGNIRLYTPFIGTARLRLGYALGRVLPFATAGVAVTYSTLDINSINVLEVQPAPGSWVPAGGGAVSYGGSAFTLGWTAGGGIEYALTDTWSAKADYLYTSLVSSDLGDPPPQLHQWRAGLNYHF